MKIWAHTICFNEENFIWYAIKSAIDFVDKIIIYDTGSTDKTVEIIKLLKAEYPEKIIFEEKGKVDINKFSVLRQEMLDRSKCDWIMVLDADEVWPKESLYKALSFLNEDKTGVKLLVNPVYNLLGDIYHYQDINAARYKIQGRKGHFNVRFISTKIPGLHIQNPYGSEGYFDGDNISIQESQKLEFIDAPYFHATHLRRSSKKQNFNKFKYELGHHIPKAALPEILFKEKPSNVSDQTKKRPVSYVLRASLETQLRKMKRKIIDDR